MKDFDTERDKISIKGDAGLRDWFKQVGRFRVREFGFDSQEALCLLEFHSGESDKAHELTGLYLTVEKFNDMGLAMIADSLPEGDEKAYLLNVHKAVYALANLQVCTNELAEPPSPGDNSDASLAESIFYNVAEFRKALQPLYDPAKLPAARPKKLGIEFKP